jgi:hypothetical protein
VAPVRVRTEESNGEGVCGLCLSGGEVGLRDLPV